MKMRDSLAIGAAAILCLSSAPAFAQSNNGGVGNSNFGGVLNSGPQGQCFGGIDKTSCFGSGSSSGSAGYSSSVLEQAQSLQQRLATAQAAASERRSSGIRAYVRNPQPAQTSAAQVELGKAKTDALAFLESVKNPGASLLGTGAGPTAKYSPTW